MGPNTDRYPDPAFGHTGDQFELLGVVEGLARLVWVLVDEVQREHQRSAGLRNGIERVEAV